MVVFNLRLTETELEVLGEMTSSFPVRGSSCTDGSVSLIRNSIRMKLQKLFYSPAKESEVYPDLISSGYIGKHDEEYENL